jgi:ribose transport system permease protein
MSTRTQRGAGAGTLRAAIERWRWIWVFSAAIAVWIATFSVAGRGTFSTLTAAATVAAYLIIVGLGQMFVITTGNGNIDLSIPYVMTLAGFIGSDVMNGKNANIFLGLVVALGCGVIAGALNVLSIHLLQIPPIVATLAVGFVLDSAAEVLAHQSALPSPSLTHFTSATVVGGVPLLALICIVISIAGALLLHRTRYGRSIQASGQSIRAAHLAGLHVRRAVAYAYLLSGFLAGLSGILLTAYSGGAALDIATPYQLESIAVVVLGGSLIAGGLSNVTGIWGAALFLTLLVTLLNVLHLSAAWQDIIEGLLIIAVLAVGGGRLKRALARAHLWCGHAQRAEPGETRPQQVSRSASPPRDADYAVVVARSVR